MGANAAGWNSAFRLALQHPSCTRGINALQAKPESHDGEELPKRVAPVRG